MRLSDLAAVTWDCLRDDTSNLWRETHPDELPFADRLAIDRVNLAYMTAITIARTAGSKSAKFEPFYTYPGGPWQEQHKESIAPAGGYVRMTTDEADRWLAAKRKRQLEAAA